MIFRIIILALFTAFCAVGFAQILPSAPTQHVALKSLEPITKGTIDENLYRVDSLLRVGDVYTTHWGISDGLAESNPLSPADGDYTRLILFQATASSGVWGTHNLLIARHHTKIARLVLVVDVISEAYSVGHNAYLISRYGK